MVAKKLKDHCPSISTLFIAPPSRNKAFDRTIFFNNRHTRLIRLRFGEKAGANMRLIGESSGCQKLLIGHTPLF